VKEFWEQFFRFLRDLFPAITAFFLGKRVGEIGKEEIRAKKDALKLELERVKNAQAVEDENRGRNDSDIVDDMVRSGLSKVSKPDGSSGAGSV
jgi:hypothetical protein